LILLLAKQNVARLVKPDFDLLGRVLNQSSQMMEQARLIKEMKLESSLSYRVAMRRNCLSRLKNYSTRLRSLYKCHGAWEALLEQLIDAPDYEWLMIDASHIKVHPHAAGARGGNQAMSLTKGGSTPSHIWPWMRLVCRSESLLRKVPPQIARRLHG